MKTSLILTVSAWALMVVGCGGAGNNEKQNEDAQPQVVETETPNSRLFASLRSTDGIFF